MDSWFPQKATARKAQLKNNITVSNNKASYVKNQFLEVQNRWKPKLNALSKILNQMHDTKRLHHKEPRKENG